MDKTIVLSKRFCRQTNILYYYLCKEFSPKAGYRFLKRLQDKIELIIKHPTIGKPSQKKANVRSVLLIPYNRIYYRANNNKIEILGLFDMRKNPSRKIY